MLIVDIETQSNIDLRERGGYVYAEDCKLICIAWSDLKSYHVWMPQLAHMPPDLKELHLPDVEVHLGPTCPIPTDEVWWGHNCFGFDEPVCNAMGIIPKKWADSMCLAAAAGLPSGLQQIAQRLWGEGKYQEGSQALKRASRSLSPIPVAQQVLIARYNVQDVRLQVGVVEELGASYVPTRTELSVLDTHRMINGRGLKLDTDLITRVYKLTNDSVDWSVAEIARLTKYALPDIKALRSRSKVISWVEQMVPDIKLPTISEVKAGKNITKISLRRDLIDHWIDEKEIEDDDDDDSDDDALPSGLPLVLRVLRLRQAAMRITSGKLKAAGEAISRDGRARGLFAYFGAHTGRWAGRRIQVHNLPRPKGGANLFFWYFVRNESVDFESLRPILDRWNLMVEEMEVGDKETVAARWLDEFRVIGASKLKHLTGAERLAPEDIASALIRGIFLGPLLAADLASIEARVLAWLAGEEWLLDAFWKGEDPYIAFAKRVTGQTITKKDKARQLWKVVLLGCIAEGTLIFTDRGWVKIEEVTVRDKVWDGIEFVSHEGVVFKGWKECVSVRGVQLTPDHEVLTDIGWVPAGDLHNHLMPDGWERFDGSFTCVDGADEEVRSMRLSAIDRGLTLPTYDILNAGPRHRFQAGSLIVHNCGYQLGSRKLGVYLAGMGIDLSEYGVSAEFAIDGYRDACPAIAGRVEGVFEGRKWRRGGLWADLEAAALSAVRGIPVETHGLRFEHRRGHLYLKLPSGREIVYRNAGISEKEWFGKTKATVRYESPRFKTVWLYGGKITENVVQAISRDIMAEMLVACEAAGLNPVLHVHDEVVCEAGPERIEEFKKIMTTIPTWAKGLPVDAEGSWLERYSKSPPPEREDEEWKCAR